ncbi:hypothetical protein UA75_04100 [Actinoalloteichus sp. GBA129-24]|uniref:Uncharacterized protein n=2 Tax=Pseudonocardiaceae TaxID=2070 RepID=A0AAC9L9L7_9PSEU|nr:hypothetical protein UA74_04000 [Actinoalloteichus fjordicus]APU18851.1 hypothetical protein UA75_04100 [Actinoalloteichus sp. GBA129-24]
MSVECQDPTDRGPLGRSQFTTRYFLDELPREDNDSNVEAVYQHWIENGYQVLVDDRPDRIFISVQHEDDAFRMSIRASVQGDLSLGASSPCIWPNGTPEPAAP